MRPEPVEGPSTSSGRNVARLLRAQIRAVAQDLPKSVTSQTLPWTESLMTSMPTST